MLYWVVLCYEKFVMLDLCVVLGCVMLCEVCYVILLCCVVLCYAM